MFEAGRELDALVAEKVMGWQSIEYNDFKIWAHQDYLPAITNHPLGFAMPEGYSPLPRYSTNIAAAWKVVEKFEAKHWEISISTDEIGYLVYLTRRNDDGGSTTFKGEADTAPLAICLAALNAKGVST